MRRRPLKIAAIVLAAIGAARTTNASVVVSNLQPYNPFPFSSTMEIWREGAFGQDVAQSFDTGAGSAVLNSVAVRMIGNLGGGGFSLQLWNDIGGSPGVPLTTLSGESNPEMAGDYTYTALPFVLTPTTTYWIVGTVSQAGPEGSAFSWSRTNQDSQTGDPGWGIGDTLRYRLIQNGFPNATWDSTGGPAQMSIDATVVAVPESAWIAVLAASLLGAFVMLRRRFATGAVV